MADPQNPNDPNVRRDEPATPPTPEPELTPDLGEEEVAQDPTAALSETLSNPKTVQAVKEFLEAEDLTIDDVEIKEGFWGWREGSDCATIEVGSREYFVSPDDDTTRAVAIALVTNDLESEPGIFNQDFLRAYIDVERLRRELYSDVYESISQDPESYGLTPEEPEEIEGEETPEPEVTEDQIEAKTEELLRDPLGYLEEIYGEKDVMGEAMRIAGIDISAAAEDAVAADGEGHFLATYDGNVYDLPSGGQWWRHN